MSAGVSEITASERDAERTRRRLLTFAGAAVVFGLLHHTDHVIRGNHSGWPFQAEVTPFTFSLLIYALILPGIYLTARGHKIAGYHLFVAVVGLALLDSVRTAGRLRSPDTQHLHSLRQPVGRAVRALRISRTGDQRGVVGDDGARRVASQGESSILKGDD